MINFFKQKNKKKKSASPKLTAGFTLVEVLVALFIFSLTMTAMMAVLGSGISNIANSKKKMSAEYLAQEGIEIVRNMRDTFILTEPTDGWDEFTTKFASCDANSAGCCLNPSGSFTNSINILTPDSEGNNCILSGTGFERLIKVQTITAGEDVKVYSKVKWTDTSGAKEIEFSENLFNWIEQ